MPNFEEDFYCQTCGYEHRNCTCHGDPRDARIAELEDCVVEQRLTIVQGDARIRELEATIARVRDAVRMRRVNGLTLTYGSSAGLVVARDVLSALDTHTATGRESGE